MRPRTLFLTAVAGAAAAWWYRSSGDTVDRPTLPEVPARAPSPSVRPPTLSPEAVSPPDDVDEPAAADAPASPAAAPTLPHAPPPAAPPPPPTSPSIATEATADQVVHDVDDSTEQPLRPTAAVHEVDESDTSVIDPYDVDGPVVDRIHLLRGVTRQTAAAVQLAFPTLVDVVDGGVDALTDVEGIGRARARRVYAVCRASTTEDLLTGIPGLGPAKISRVASAFPTVEAFLAATDRALFAVPGINADLGALLAERRRRPEDSL